MKCRFVDGFLCFCFSNSMFSQPTRLLRRVCRHVSEKTLWTSHFEMSWITGYRSCFWFRHTGSKYQYRYQVPALRILYISGTRYQVLYCIYFAEAWSNNNMILMYDAQYFQETSDAGACVATQMCYWIHQADATLATWACRIDKIRSHTYYA